MTNQKKPTDWTEIERDYRSTSTSLMEIARWYGISDTAIRKRAKARGWVRAGSTPEPSPARTLLTPANASPEAIVGRGRNLTLRMLDELDAQTSQIGELGTLIDSAIDTGDGGKARDAAHQAISLKQRAEVLKALALTAKTLAEAGAPAGKKAERQEAAEKVAGSSKFAPPPAPKLVVDNR
jgi:hypothetical protein